MNMVGNASGGAPSASLTERMTRAQNQDRDRVPRAPGLGLSCHPAGVVTSVRPTRIEVGDGLAPFAVAHSRDELNDGGAGVLAVLDPCGAHVAAPPEAPAAMQPLPTDFQNGAGRRVSGGGHMHSGARRVSASEHDDLPPPLDGVVAFPFLHVGGLPPVPPVGPSANLRPGAMFENENSRQALPGPASMGAAGTVPPVPLVPPAAASDEAGASRYGRTAAEEATQAIQVSWLRNHPERQPGPMPPRSALLHHDAPIGGVATTSPTPAVSIALSPGPNGSQLVGMIDPHTWALFLQFQSSLTDRPPPTPVTGDTPWMTPGGGTPDLGATVRAPALNTLPTNTAHHQLRATDQGQQAGLRATAGQDQWAGLRATDQGQQAGLRATAGQDQWAQLCATDMSQQAQLRATDQGQQAVLRATVGQDQWAHQLRATDMGPPPYVDRRPEEGTRTLPRLLPTSQDMFAATPRPNLYSTLGTAAPSRDVGQEPEWPSAAGGGGEAARQSDVRSLLTRRSQDYCGSFQVPTGRGQYRWIDMPHAQFLCGKGESEVNDWVQALVTYLTNIVKEEDVPTVAKVILQMTQRIQAPSPAHQAYTNFRNIVVELASVYRVEERVGTFTIPRVPLPSERANYLVWLVREALLLYFKPDTAEALRRYDDFSPLDSKGQLIWTEPVALLAEYQRAYEDVRKEQPSLTEALLRAFVFLDHLAGEYHFVDYPADTRPGLGSQLRSHFFGLGENGPPTLSWQTLASKAVQLWQTLTNQHACKDIIFTSGQFAEKVVKGPTIKAAKVNALQNQGASTATGGQEISTANWSGAYPPCFHCNGTSHEESNCWHFYPDHADCPSTFIPSTTAGYDLWQRSRAELGMPPGADFIDWRNHQQMEANSEENTPRNSEENTPCNSPPPTASYLQPPPAYNQLGGQQGSRGNGGQFGQHERGNGGGRGWAYPGDHHHTQSTWPYNPQNVPPPTNRGAMLRNTGNQLGVHAINGEHDNHQRGQGSNTFDYDRLASMIAESIIKKNPSLMHQHTGRFGDHDARNSYGANSITAEHMPLGIGPAAHTGGGGHQQAADDDSGPDEWDVDYGKESGRFFSSAGDS